MLDRTRAALVILLAAVVASAPARADEEAWSLVEEHWYVMEIAEARAGWMSSKVFESAEQFRTEMVSNLTVRRGTLELHIETTSQFVETRSGEPVRVHYVADMSMQEVDTEWRFEDDHVVSVVRQGDRVLTRTVDRPSGEWLTPMGVQRFLKERHAAGAKQITYRALNPESGLEPVTITSERVGTETFEIDGRSIPVTVWKTSTDSIPLPATEKYSADTHLVYVELAAPMGRLVTRLASKRLALAVGDAPAPELMLKTFVKPSRPIPNVMSASKARLGLRAREGELPVLPSAAAQRVEPDEANGRVVVTVDLSRAVEAGADERTDESYLGSSALIDPTDPLIRKLAYSAVKDIGEDPAEKAEAMRSRVYRHITGKGLQTAFASASETAKTRAGDCSEHAVLLAAMCRVEEIPARVAMGLVYVESFAGESDIFGWHMWTQALIDDAWVDLDATLPVRYHAGHVLTSTSSLADESGNDELASILMLMGNMEIEVIDVEYGGGS
jgi:hypothetical protein